MKFFDFVKRNYGNFRRVKIFKMEGLENMGDENFEVESLKHLNGFDKEVDFDPEDKLDLLIVNESEYIGKRLSTDNRVPGSICNPKYYSYWKDVLKAPDFVLETLREGYKFPLKEIPPVSRIDSF